MYQERDREQEEAAARWATGPWSPEQWRQWDWEEAEARVAHDRSEREAAQRLEEQHHLRAAVQAAVVNCNSFA